MPTYETIVEHRLSRHQRAQITALRNANFPEHAVPRSYFKQLPHVRMLASEAGQLVGYTGVDHRVIRLGAQPVTTFGIIDLCVSAEHRGLGIASTLVKEVCVLGETAAADFVILCADDARLYLRHGFAKKSNVCSWLKIDDHQNYGIARESLADCLMVKALGATPWTDEDVDLLGYLF